MDEQQMVLCFWAWHTINKMWLEMNQLVICDVQQNASIKSMAHGGNCRLSLAKAERYIVYFDKNSPQQSIEYI
jgi:hypothetical protein